MKKQILAAAIATLAAQSFAANYYLVVPVQNRVATTGNITVSLNAYGLPAGLAGRAYAGFDFNPVLQVKGDPNFNPSSVTWSVVGGALPDGLALAANGLLTGTPTKAGTSSFQVMALYKSKAGQQAYQVVVGEVTVGLASASLPAAVQGASYFYDLKPLVAVTGDPAFTAQKLTWAVAGGALPDGLHLNTDGTITGVATAEGAGSITVQASYLTGVGSQSYQVVAGAITVSLASAQLPVGQQGAAYSYDLKSKLSVAGDAAYAGTGVTWSLAAGSLPAGLTLGAGGVISGTPSAENAGTPFTIQAAYKNKAGQQAYSVVVGAITVSLASASLPAVKVDAAYSYDFKSKLSVTGDAAYPGNGAGVTWSLAAGSLPPGIVLDAAAGSISGIPTAVGTNAFTAKATYKGKSAQQDYAVQVNAKGLTLQAAGYRTWEDGAVAASCKTYRTGTNKYAYTGATGSGTYRIQPAGMPATTVYCDMTTDGGGWMLAAWNKGNAGLANMPVDFFVQQVNAANIANRNLINASSSLNVEAYSKAIVTNDVMLVSGAYSAAPIIENGQGVWSYDSPDCNGAIGHSGRNAGCANHSGNDDYSTADRFNIAIYPDGMAIVPGWLNWGYELCWSGRGWCDFEFYIR